MYTLFLPIEHVEVPIVVVSTQVEGLEKHIIPKHGPFNYTIDWGRCKGILIDIVTHAYEVFKTLNIVLKDTSIVERQGSQPVLLAEPVGTTCEQPIDDLIVGVKHVVLGDWFQGQNIVFKGGYC